MVDDASSRGLARFVESDGTLANMEVLEMWLVQHGRMLGCYTDKAGHFQTAVKTKARSSAAVRIGRVRGPVAFLRHDRIYRSDVVGAVRQGLPLRGSALSSLLGSSIVPVVPICSNFGSAFVGALPLIFRDEFWPAIPRSTHSGTGARSA
jgi:hypothetical protein